jgi:SMI1 / KNR4 family (SUKH-1)
MNEQLNRIKEKIRQLKKSDRNYTLFGSETHKYKINPPISPDKIRLFEAKYKVVLPKDYVEFLTEIGNGGVGPFYGLEPFENVLFDDLDYKRPDSLLNPGTPFLHTKPWNLKFRPSVNEDENEEQYESEWAEFEEKYFDNKHMNGAIAICNFGCAISLNLIVNGQEYGHIWTDDRASDNGIYPSTELGNKNRITFSDWYELWLDNSLNEIKTKQITSDKPNLTEMPLEKKSWWKIWQK